jgi:hypothetical protein
LQVKDYYKILEIEPSATGDEIKKAYRRLAHLYHPDKHAADVYASAKFSEIKEAYEILSNPFKKEYYLQQRWFAQSTGKPISNEITTPVTMLKKMLALDRYVSTLDAHRIHYQSLYVYICDLLSDENIQIINGFGDHHVNEEIVRSTLKTAQGLPYRLIQPLATRTRKLDVEDEAVKSAINRFVVNHKKADEWEKMKVWIITLLVLLICMIIFFSTS